MVSKEKWAEVIKDWQERKLPIIIKRERKINFESDMNRAISIIGPRRAGKTYEMFDIINDISSKYGRNKTLYVDFEKADLGALSYKDLSNMLETYYELFPENIKERIWIFLDEIQNVLEWEKFVRTCLDEGIKVFLSGSSSKLLSKEIATSMRGRNISYKILPFSFKEYLSSKNFEIKKYYSSLEKSEISKYLQEYLIWGGYPESVIYKEERNKILQDIFQTAILKDVIERNKIRNSQALKIFISALLSSKEFSINKFYNYLKSQNIKISKDLLYNFLIYLEDAFFVYSLRKFNLSYKKSDQSLPKIYFVDNGLLTVNNIDDQGKLLENMVFIELLRRELNIAYYQNNIKEEIDFVIFNGKKIEKLIQVCANTEDFMTFNREIRILLKASEKFNCQNLLIITNREEGEKNIENKKINLIPLWKFLLNENPQE